MALSAVWPLLKALFTKGASKALLGQLATKGVAGAVPTAWGMTKAGLGIAGKAAWGGTLGYGIGSMGESMLGLGGRGGGGGEMPQAQADPSALLDPNQQGMQQQVNQRLMQELAMLRQMGGQ